MPGVGVAGPPALLVHGFAQNRRAFLSGPVPGLLAARGVRVFVGELRGHGLSRFDVAGRPFGARRSLDDHVDRDLPALVEHVLRLTGERRLHYMGHSMGGLVGLALLGRSPPFISLTAWATPLYLGASRPAVAVAAWVVRPFLIGSPRSVPMRALLHGVSGLATYPGPRGPRRAVGRWLGLANPDHAPRDHLSELLSQSENESGRIMRALADLPGARRPRLCGVDLVSAVHRWPGRLAFVVGTRDIFAPPPSVTPILRLDQAGPRRLFTIREGHHVDVAVGHPVTALFEDLATFIGA